MLRANDNFAPRAGTRVAYLSLVSFALLTIAVLVGTMIGPAGPQWWRVPLELVDRLPLITVDSGVSPEEWNIVWQIRMPRVVLAVLVGAMLSVAERRKVKTSVAPNPAPAATPNKYGSTNGLRNTP